MENSTTIEQAAKNQKVRKGEIDELDKRKISKKEEKEVRE